MLARPHRTLTLLFAAFTLSGFAGLIYESIWTHYLKLFLGHAAYAQTLVLAIFMGGMSIGSWLSGRRSTRWPDLLRTYAMVEAAVGVLALAFHPIFTGVLAISYGRVIPALGNAGAIAAYKWTLSAVLILPASILLGMTFPLMTTGVLRAFPDRPGRSIAMLYFTNSLGAAVGVLVSGFALIRLLGLPGTIVLAGLLNLTLAALIWWLAPPPTPATQDVREHDSSPALGHRATALLAVSLVTGASSFMYEVGWIRMLSLVLGSSTHAFELMLSAFILGLAFGGLWIQRRIDRAGDPLRFLAAVQLLMGFLALSTVLVYGQTFGVMRWIVEGLEKSEAGYAAFNLSSNAIALAIMLPATFCAGMTLPLITFVLLRDGYGERTVGHVYAANTVGAIVGVMVAVHVGLPLLGLKGLLALGASLDLGLGVLLLWPSARAKRTYASLAATAAVAALAVGATLLLSPLDEMKMASGVFRQGELLDPAAQRLLFHRDGKTATVSIVEEVSTGMRSIRTNGKSDASLGMRPGMPPTSDEYTMVLMAALPAMYRPDLRDAAVIGFGSGLTTHSLLSIPSLVHVETVEIEPLMVEASNFFRPAVERAYTDPRGSIHIDDAKTFFSNHGRTYDLVVSEPSNPWVSGVASLFSTEFYRLVRTHLREGGLFVQWVQLYEIDLPLVTSVLRALEPEFADFVMFAPNNGDLLIVASKDRPLAPVPSGAVLETPEFKPLAQRLGIRGVQDLLARQVGNRRVLSTWLSTRSIEANSDYHPVLDQNAARARFLGAFAWDLLEFGRVPLPTLELLGGQPPPPAATPVTPSGYSDLSLRAAKAAALKEILATGQVPPLLAWTASPEDRRRAARFRELLWSCGGAPESAERLNLAFGLAVETAPYLSPAELASAWGVLEGSPCWPSRSPDERAWYALFEAVGQRDAAAMRALSQQLLASPGGRNGPPGRYVTAAAMLGALAQRDRVAARSVWAAAPPALFGTQQPELLFQVLEAESRAR